MHLRANTPLDENTEKLATAVVDACFEVHRILGPGFLESVYDEALAVELDSRGIPHRRQASFAVNYKSRQIGEGRLDYVVDERVLVELKAVNALADIHHAQVISYLKLTGMTLALLINFNTELFKHGIRRIVRTDFPARSGRD